MPIIGEVRVIKAERTFGNEWYRYEYSHTQRWDGRHWQPPLPSSNIVSHEEEDLKKQYDIAVVNYNFILDELKKMKVEAKHREEKMICAKKKWLESISKKLE